MPILILAVALVPLLWAIGAYNGLVRLRNHCREAWAGIDTELKRRYELIPNLVETVKGYVRHEREALEGVVAARQRAVASTGSPESQARDETALVQSLGRLFALAESYPDLKANQNFLQLQKELVNTEDRIQASCRLYNANVRDFNTRIEVFPSNLIASAFSFARMEFFEVAEAAVRAPVKVQF